MRLSEAEVAAIKSAACEAFGEGVVVRLFGSRLRDDLKGGDIDLLVEVVRPGNEAQQKALFEHRFWSMTEPRKIDLLVAVKGTVPGPFERIAYRDGVVL